MSLNAIFTGDAIPFDVWDGASLAIYGSAQDFIDYDVDNNFPYDRFFGNWYFEARDDGNELGQLFYNNTLPDWSTLVIQEFGNGLYVDISDPNITLNDYYVIAEAGHGVCCVRYG